MIARSYKLLKNCVKYLSWNGVHHAQYIQSFYKHHKSNKNVFVVKSNFPALCDRMNKFIIDFPLFNLQNSTLCKPHTQTLRRNMFFKSHPIIFFIYVVNEILWYVLQSDLLCFHEIIVHLKYCLLVTPFKNGNDLLIAHLNILLVLHV